MPTTNKKLSFFLAKLSLSDNHLNTKEYSNNDSKNMIT